MNSIKKTIIGLVVLAATACQTTQANKSAVETNHLTVETFTANEAGFLVNSHLIQGQKDAILVDAQFTRSQARKVSEMVRRSGKNLKQIYITHAHPDHYLGLEILTRDFPTAKVVASAEVIAEIKSTAPAKIEYWKKLYGEDLAETFVLPQPVNAAFLELEGERIELVNLLPGESEHSTVLYIPSMQTMLTGDMAYNQVHLWLAEDRPESWLKNLTEVRKVGEIANVLPGHGAKGNGELLDANEAYIEKFLAITSKAKNKEQAVAELKASFPTYQLPIIAELSVAARIK